jgi:hypothetical protein
MTVTCEKLTNPQSEYKYAEKGKQKTYFSKYNLKRDENLHQISIGHKKSNIKYVL